MDSSTSSFSEVEQSFPDAELLEVGGTTCECYRVKLYGKLHFLKRLKPELRTHPQYAAALQKEFELGYPLEHPHLVRYTAKTPDGILMEYVDGETLSEFAEHHPDYFAKREQADRFLQQLLSVVGYLHSHQTGLQLCRLLHRHDRPYRQIRRSRTEKRHIEGGCPHRHLCHRAHSADASLRSLL